MILRIIYDKNEYYDYDLGEIDNTRSRVLTGVYPICEITVLYLHNASDIFVHLTRLLIQTDCPEWIKNFSGIFLTCSMLYTRLYVFGEAIATLYFYATWEWGFTLDFLFLFLTFLYLMHINWCLLLLSKFYLIIVGNKLSDTVAFKKTLKQVKIQ